jgi:hypothetical protein
MDDGKVAVYDQASTMKKVLSNPDNMVLKEILEIYRDVDNEQCRKLFEDNRRRRLADRFP